MLSSIKAGAAPATLKKVTYRQLVKAAATVRNQTVTYGGVTPLELAFGRRPADLIQLDVATPTQLTIDRNEEEMTESLQKEQPGSPADTKKKESSAPAPKPKSSVPSRVAGKTTPKPAAPHPAENMFVEDLTSVPEQAHWNCVRKGKIHVLEIFAGSARFSQCCALSGLKVGTPVDIRTGFAVMTSKGRHMVMEIIKEQAPDAILMAPVCGPWSNMQNIQQDQQRVWEKRKRYLPMVECDIS